MVEIVAKEIFGESYEVVFPACVHCETKEGTNISFLGENDWETIKKFFGVEG